MPSVTKTVKAGERVTKPAAPQNGYYEFTGWYEDQECTIPYDFTSLVKESKTLYAGWLTDEDAYATIIFEGTAENSWLI